MWSRTLVLMLAAVALIAVGVVAAAVLTRDDPPAVTGDLIAYSCKEKRNPWFAICVIHEDGTERRRLTSDVPATDPAWSPDGRKIAFTRREDVGELHHVLRGRRLRDGFGRRRPHQLTEEARANTPANPRGPPTGGDRLHARRSRSNDPSRTTRRALRHEASMAQMCGRLTRWRARSPPRLVTGRQRDRVHARRRAALRRHLGRRRCGRASAPADEPSGPGRRIGCLVARRVSDRVHAHEAGERDRRRGVRVRHEPRRDECAGAGPAPLLLLLHVRARLVSRREDDRVRDVAVEALYRDLTRRRREWPGPPVDEMHATARVGVVARLATRHNRGSTVDRSSVQRQ